MTDLRTLADLGFSFASVNNGQKGPRYKGWNVAGKSLSEIEQHHAAGGNVGVLCGPASGIICVDVDAGLAQILAKAPELLNTLQCYRPNASDRRKFFLRIDGELPLATKFKDGAVDVDLLSKTKTGKNSNATVLGAHPSGATYTLQGDAVQTVSRAQFEQWWLDWTGELLEAPRRHTERPTEHDYEPRNPDNLIEQVKIHWSAYGVFDHHGLAQDVSRNAGGYRLHDHGGLDVGDPDNPNKRHEWYCHGAGVGGDQIDAWHYCQHGRILDRSDRQGFVETLHAMATAAGIEIPKSSGVFDPDQVRAEIPLIRGWVKSTSFADYVPQELQSAVGYRTDSTDTKVADSILDIAEEHGTFRVYISRRALALRAGLGDHKTAQKALERLAGWFVTLHKDGCIEVARRFPTSNLQATELVGNLRATYSERKADDLFLSGRSKTARMLGNEEPGLGETILRVIDAIEIHGSMDRAELVDTTGKTKSAIVRATLRAERLGLLASEQEHGRMPKVYSLADGWAESVEVLRPYLKTYKLGIEREKRNCEQVIAYCRRLMKSAEGPSLRRLAKRLARTEKRLGELLPQIYEWMTPADVEQWLSTPNGKQAELSHSMDRPHADWMMEISQYQRRREMENVAQIEADLAGGWEHMAAYAMAAD